MAFWKRRSRNFEPVSPQTRYTVTYLGHEEMSGKVGLDNTLKPVDDLFRQFKTNKSKSPGRMQIEVVNNGIRVQPMDAGVSTLFVGSPYLNSEGTDIFFPIHKLSFGAADPFHTRVFCFVSRNDSPSQSSHWDCHAVLCDSTAMAKNLTLYLVKAFQRIGDSKDNPLVSGRRSKKTTTVHILRERGTSEYQLSKKKGKRPPVSTIRVTLNVESKTEQFSSKQLEENKTIADILAKQQSMEVDVSRDDVERTRSDVKDNGNTIVLAGHSDKENEGEDELADDGDEMPQEIEVTVAMNPEMSSPPESPRKSPRTGETTSSGEENDVQFVDDVQTSTDGKTSPQAMITTMSPPDTPGYLSSEDKDKTSAFSDMSSASNSRVETRDVVATDTSRTPSSSSPTHKEEDSSPSSAPRRKSPSPPNSSPAASQRTADAKASTCDSSTDAKNTEKKAKREKKSVRFSESPELIG
ncbi:uncharacterized protein [Diadema setosum]|uniref:uncharacterized protein n=1 Tax=Diadema setosum TaxID=31175 RepID=UPI003B3BA1C1